MSELFSQRRDLSDDTQPTSDPSYETEPQEIDWNEINTVSNPSYRMMQIMAEFPPISSALTQPETFDFTIDEPPIAPDDTQIVPIYDEHHRWEWEELSPSESENLISNHSAVDQADQDTQDVEVAPFWEETDIEYFLPIELTSDQLLISTCLYTDEHLEHAFLPDQQKFVREKYAILSEALTEDVHWFFDDQSNIQIMVTNSSHFVRSYFSRKLELDYKDDIKDETSLKYVILKNASIILELRSLALWLLANDKDQAGQIRLPRLWFTDFDSLDFDEDDDDDHE